MRKHTLNGLLRDASNAILFARFALAFRFLANAEQIALNDDSVPVRVHDLIVDAREAVATRLSFSAA